MCEACLALPTVFAPEIFCAHCRTPFLREGALNDEGLCGLCRRGVTRFDAAYSFGSYDGVLRDLIHIFKYGRVETLARPLGRLMARALPRDHVFDALAPVPMHWWRQYQRGFNQSRLLAQEIARSSGLPVEMLVRRRRRTAAQAGMTSAKRRSNVANAFDVPHPERVAGKRLLVVDDVLTTGATVNACAAALKAAGAERVAVLTLARVDRRVSGAMTALMGLADSRLAGASV